MKSDTRTVINSVYTTLLFVHIIRPASSIGHIEQKSNWDNDAREHTLNLHNKFRRNMRMCHVNQLVYDIKLERLAKEWASRCVFKQATPGQPGFGFGQNHAYLQGSKNETAMINIAMGAWYRKREKYKYGTGDCKGACDYTQLVWADTEAVGCYSTRCVNLIMGKPNAWYFVCLYDPHGNWEGREPYDTACTEQCYPNQKEDKSLCVGTPPCENKDQDSNCKWYAFAGQCAAIPTYMGENCRKTCNVCDRRSRGGWVNGGRVRVVVDNVMIGLGVLTALGFTFVY